MKSDVLEKLATAAWYLHSNRDGKLFFKNVENLNAKLESLARTYVREQSLKELRTRLTDLFQPVNSWCYQDVLSLPAIDEIEPAQDRTAIVISEPYVGHGLNPQLKQFWEQTTFKNRVAFLTGARNTFDNLIESAKRLKAIQHIIDEMVKDKTPENDPQFKQADELRDRILAQFLSAVKETFSTLYYPTRQSNADVLVPADFLMQFEGNKYNGEDQIIQVLKDKQKYTEDVDKRHLPQEDRGPAVYHARHAVVGGEEAGRDQSAVAVAPPRRPRRDEERSGPQGSLAGRRRRLRRSLAAAPQDHVRPDSGTQPERRHGRGRVEGHPRAWRHGLCRDRRGGDDSLDEGRERPVHQRRDGGLASWPSIPPAAHPQGPAQTWKNRVTLKYRLFSGPTGQKMLELKAAPNGGGRTEVRYTTDGSDPKLNGGTYDSPVAIVKGTQVVLAVAECDGTESEVLSIPIRWDAPETEKADRSRQTAGLEAAARMRHHPGVL